MNQAFRKSTCRALVAALLALSFHSAQAGLIGADQAAASTAGADRALVLETLARSDVASQLQAAGVDPQAARERVASMTEQEVQALARDIQAAPAGAMSDGWVVVTVIAVAALVWYYWIRK